MENKETIGAKIVALRKSRGYTQADLGVYLNISYQAVSKWERGESCPDFETLSKIAQLFNVPISYFEKNGELAMANAATSSAVATPVAVQNGEAEEEEEKEEERKMLGVCKDCGNVVYDDNVGLRYPTLICKACQSRRKRIADAKAAEQKRAEEKKKAEIAMQEAMRREKAVRVRNRGLIFGGIAAGGCLFFVMAAGVGALIFSALIFFFVSQLFWDGAVVDCALAGGKVIGTPGIIFEFSLDGFIFLIGMKILFALLRLGVMVFTSLVCVLAAIFISPFTFLPAMHRVTREGVDY